MKLLSTLVLFSSSILGMYQLDRLEVKECSHEHEEHVSSGAQLLLHARSGSLKNPCGILLVEDYLSSPIDLSLCDVYGSALMWCCFHGLDEIAALLIKAGADINGTGRAGYTPLHAAAQQGHLAVVQHLLDEEAFDDAQTVNGTTPLQLASQEGHVEVVRALVACGSDPELEDIYCRTPLHLAVMRGHYHTTYELLRHQANSNARAWHGITPLYIAAYNNNPVLIRLLLDNKAQVTAQTVDRETALMIAQRHSYDSVVKILSKHTERGQQRTKRPVTP